MSVACLLGSHYLYPLLLEGNEVLADSNKQGVAGWCYFATKVMDYREIVRAAGGG